MIPDLANQAACEVVNLHLADNSFAVPFEQPHFVLPSNLSSYLMPPPPSPLHPPTSDWDYIAPSIREEKDLADNYILINLSLRPFLNLASSEDRSLSPFSSSTDTLSSSLSIREQSKTADPRSRSPSWSADEQ